MKTTHFFLSIICFLGIVVGCSPSDTGYQKEKAARLEKARRLEKLSKVDALPLEFKTPADNPISEQKIELGRMLFFDPILSGNKDVACATCHHPSNGYAELRDVSIGVNGKGLSLNRAFNEPNTIPLGKRNAHTILNTAFNGMNTANKYVPEEAPMFWDNRIKSLEGQALEPIKSFDEMRGTRYEEDEILDEVVARLFLNTNNCLKLPLV